MFRYYCKKINGEIYVVHTDTGCTLRYEPRGRLKDQDPNCEYKADVFAKWCCMSNRQRQNIMKETYLNNCTQTCTGTYSIPFSLDNCTTATIELLSPGEKHERKLMAFKAEQEKKMGYNNNATGIMITQTDTDQQKISILLNALSNTYDAKYFDLRRKYGLEDDEAPQKGQEFVDRILAGKYIVKTVTQWGEETSKIRWRDPSLKEDRDGFDTAQTALSNKRDAAHLDIQIKAPLDGLAVLREFESTTIN